MSLARQLCTFRVGDLFLGLDVLSVQEVIRSPELAPVPLAADTIEGLLNLRGQILTAIDLRRLLELPAPAGSAASMLLILRTSGGQVALVVDAVEDVMDVDTDTFEFPPETVPASVRHFILGVHKLERRILHVLDAEATGAAHVSHAPSAAA